MYQKNELKNLIYIQENKPCNEQTIKGLFRSIVDPILETSTECLVLFRLEEKSKNDFNSILRRLEYSKADVYDFSTTPFGEKFENILKENIWEKTEFIYILAERFGATLIFDYEDSGTNDNGQFYILHNSKNLSDIFDILNSNSTKDLGSYQSQWHPDRRNNEVLNSSIRKIIENLNEAGQEMLISKIEEVEDKENNDIAPRLEFLLAKSSYIAHEMRNMLSIANLYSDIIEKQSRNVSFPDESTKKSIINARDCIRKSLQMTGNLLLDFKSLRNTDLKECDLDNLIGTAIELSRVYANGKNINFENKNSQTINILADENKFLTVLINLIKNAVESIEEKGDIIINTEIEDEVVKIIISNNGNTISEDTQDKIFEEGFSTKASGSGLGLVICKKTLEEQFAQLKLKKSDEISTEFEITVLKSGG